MAGYEIARDGMDSGLDRFTVDRWFMFLSTQPGIEVAPRKKLPQSKMDMDVFPTI